MVHWYEHWAAKIGLRIAGLMLLASAWPEENLLGKLVLSNPAADMNLTEYLLGALLVMSASAGAMLIIMGPSLWKPVLLSERWSARSPPVAPADKARSAETRPLS